jgi:hypothetical protein
MKTPAVHFIMFPYNGSIHIFLFCPGHERTRLASSKSMCKCNDRESHGTCLRWNLQFGKLFGNCLGAQQTCGSVTRSSLPKPRAPVRAYLKKAKQEYKYIINYATYLYHNKKQSGMDLSFSSAISLHTVPQQFTPIEYMWIQTLSTLTI